MLEVNMNTAFVLCLLFNSIYFVLFRWMTPPPFYTASNQNSSSALGYPDLDLMMASRGRNMLFYN